MKHFDNFRENYKITCAMHTNLDYFTLFKVNTQTHNLACENLDHLVRIRKKSKELKASSKWRKQHCTSYLSHINSVFNSKWRILWSKSDAPKKMKTIRSKGPLYHFKYKGRKISGSAPLTYRVGKERKKGRSWVWDIALEEVVLPSEPWTLNTFRASNWSWK